MRLIRQRFENDCGIAVAAMAARVSYVRAKKLLPGYSVNFGITAKKLREVLNKLTKRRWRKIKLVGELPRLNEFSYEGEAVIMIYNPFKKKGLKYHYALVKGGYYYDPDLNAPVKLRSTKLRQWKQWRVWEILTTTNSHKSRHP